VLIPETEAVWTYLREHPALRGFVLVGGTGLALRIGHRLSQDLDFVWCGSRLPVKRLSMLCREAEKAGFHFSTMDDPAALEEFQIAGMELRDYQQAYLVNHRVKVSFFCAETALVKVLASDPQADCRIATLRELFEAKALVSASRSKSRNWLDLFLLMRDHGFTLDDYATAFAKAGIPNQSEIGLSRLCSGKPQANDEGFEELIDQAPSIAELAAFFRNARDHYEVRLAAEARRSESDPESQ